MSEPVTNFEIEDVLSSIRRLVAEGERKRQETSAPEKTGQAAADKFVLTPALRVTPEPAEEATIAPLQLEPEQAVTDESGWETAPDNFGQDDDADTGFIFHATAANADDAPTEEPAADTNADESNADEAEIARLTRASLEATIAELEAAVTAQADDWEPDGSEVAQAAAPSWDRMPFRIVGSAEDAQYAAEDDETTDVAEPDNMVAAFPPFRHRHDSADLEEDHEDELIGGSDSPTAEPFDDELAAYLADDAPIDEEQLRAMVLQIVRQELQGELGERITRNVRKLVRREIHRVLSELDAG